MIHLEFHGGNEVLALEVSAVKLSAILPTTIELLPSTSKQNIPETCEMHAKIQISGCSNPQPTDIDHLLERYDFDTLINPAIFKNILDPTLATSDSTPTLNPLPSNVENVSGDSGDTTVSSIYSYEQVQTIQKALQKASLADGSDQSLSRKDPDGGNNISE